MVLSHFSSEGTITVGASTFTVTITSKGVVAAHWIDTILSLDGGAPPDPVVGVGMEWAWSSGDSSVVPGPVKIAVLQLCVGRHCLVFQLLHCDHFPQNLRDFFKDDRFYFVGMGILTDFRKLSNQFPPLMVGDRVYDLRDLAVEKMHKLRMKQWDLKDLVQAIIPEMPMEMPIQALDSNWGGKVLENKQIDYASLNAIASCEVGRRLLATNS